MKYSLNLYLKWRILKYKSYTLILKLLGIIKSYFSLFNKISTKIYNKEKIVNKFSYNKLEQNKSFKIWNFFLPWLFYILIVYWLLSTLDLSFLFAVEEICKQIASTFAKALTEQNIIPKIVYNSFLWIYEEWMDWVRIINFFNIYIPDELKDPGIRDFFQSSENISYVNSARIGWFGFGLYLKTLRGGLEWDVLQKIRVWLRKKGNLSRFLKIYTEELNLKLNEKIPFDKKVLFLFKGIMLRIPFFVKNRLKQMNSFLYHKIICNMDFDYVKKLQPLFLFTITIVLTILVFLQSVIDFMFFLLQDLYVYLLYLNKLQFDIFHDFYLYLKQYIFYNICYFFNKVFCDNNLFILLQSIVAYIFEYNKYTFVIFKNIIIDWYYDIFKFEFIRSFKNQLFVRCNLFLEYYQEMDYRRKLQLFLKLPKKYKPINVKQKYAQTGVLWNAFYPEEILDKLLDETSLTLTRKIYESFLFNEYPKIKFMINWEPIWNSNLLKADYLQKTYDYLLFIWNFIISLFVLGFFWFLNLKKDINYIYVENSYNILMFFTIRRNDLLDYVNQYWEIMIAKMKFEEAYDDDEFDKELDWRIPTLELAVSDKWLAFEKYYSEKIYDIESTRNNYTRYRQIELKSESMNKDDIFLNNMDMQAYTLARLNPIPINFVNRIKGYIYYCAYIFKNFLNNSLSPYNLHRKKILYNLNIIYNYKITRNRSWLFHNQLISKALISDLTVSNNFNYLLSLARKFYDREHLNRMQASYYLMNMGNENDKLFVFLSEPIFKWLYFDPNYRSFNAQLYVMNKIYKKEFKEKTMNNYLDVFRHEEMSSEWNFLNNLGRIIIYIFVASTVYIMVNGLLDLEFLYNIKQTLSLLFYYILAPMQVVTSITSNVANIIEKVSLWLIDLYYLRTIYWPDVSEDFFQFSVLTYYNLVWLWEEPTTMINQILLSMKILNFYELLSDQLDLNLETFEGIEKRFIEELVNIDSLRSYISDIEKVESKWLTWIKMPKTLYLHYKKLIITLFYQLYLSWKDTVWFLFGFNTSNYIKKAKQEMKATIFSEFKIFKKVAFHIEYLIKKKLNLFKEENSFLNGFVSRNKATWNDTEKEKWEVVLKKWEKLDETLFEVSNITSRKDDVNSKGFVKTTINNVNRSIGQFIKKLHVWKKSTSAERVTGEKKKRIKTKNMFTWDFKVNLKAKKRYPTHYRVIEFINNLQDLNKHPTKGIWDYRNQSNRTDKLFFTLYHYLHEVLWRVGYTFHRKYYNVYQGKKMYHELDKKYKELFTKIYQDNYKVGDDIQTRLKHYRYNNRKWVNFISNNKYFYDFKLRRLKDFEGSFIRNLFSRFLRYRKDFVLRMEEDHPVEVFNAFFERQGLFWSFKDWGSVYRDKIISIGRDNYRSRWANKNRFVKFVERRAHISRILVFKKVKRLYMRTWLWRIGFRKTIIERVKKKWWKNTKVMWLETKNRSIGERIKHNVEKYNLMKEKLKKWTQK